MIIYLLGETESLFDRFSQYLYIELSMEILVTPKFSTREDAFNAKNRFCYKLNTIIL